ncbi:MAG: YjbQ family protein [Spirochaetaceae bacterium]|nr:MAG: YjbQ family protein [Spirochaetaceae bacterium]
MVHGRELEVSSKGFSDILEITSSVAQVVKESRIRNGLVNVSVIGSTASVSTIEYEPALVEDVKEQLERLIPHTLTSRHSATWGDDNGFSHIRATLMGPSMTLPVVDGVIGLGTWQQIVVIDHDNRPRKRRIHIQVVGE